MTIRAEKYKVGIFLLVSGILFVLFLGFVIGRTLFRRNITYLIRFKETVRGLASGSQVNYNGVPVGSVVDMWLDGNTTVVRISINPKKAVVQRGVTRAALERNPITGLATVELKGWEKGKEMLEDGMEIPADPSWGAEVMKTFPELLREFPATLRSISEAAKALKDLLGGDMRTRIMEVIQRLNRLTQELPKAINDLNRSGVATLDSVRKAADRLAESVERIDAEISMFSKKGREVLSEAKETLHAGREFIQDERNKETIASIKELAEKFKKTLKELELVLKDTREDMGPMVVRFQEAASSISRIVDMLESAPSALIWGEKRREREIPEPGPGKKGERK